MNLFENLQMLREANETEDKKLDLTNYTVKEFAELIDEDSSIIQQLMRDCSSCSYVNNPYEAVVAKVKKSKVAEDKFEIVSKFIHANLFNNSPHRFYNGRGWGPTMRKTV